MEHRKLAWWQIYLLVPLMFGLLALEHFFPLPRVSADEVDAGAVVLVFVAALLWVQVNGGLLEWYYIEHDEPHYDLKITVYEPAAARKKQQRILSHGPNYLDSPTESLESFAKRKTEMEPEEQDRWLLN